MRAVENMDCPWPGPRPYEEREWPIFYGRTREVDQVLRRFSVQKLTVLSGPSGTGKTSLLRAGIVPRLRIRRYQERAENAWPVLVIREWGLGTKSGRQGLLMGALIQRALNGLREWQAMSDLVSRDLGTIGKIVEETHSEPDDPVLVVEKIASANGINGLFLVLDQFEEVIRRGKGVAKGTVQFLKDVYESGLPVKVLVSLRQEHVADLRELERTVGGLMGQTVFLRPMEKSTAKQAVGEAARARDIELADDVVGEIVNAIGVGDEEPYSLLALQAVLFDFFSEQMKIDSTKRKLSIADLRRYSERFAQSEKEAKSLANVALERWIQRALATPSGDQSLGADLREDAMNALIRRVAIRLGPHLSSGGFKVPQEDTDLLKKSIGEDLRVLERRRSEQRWSVRVSSISPPLLDTSELDLSVAKGEIGKLRLSGLALAAKWSPYRTANEMLRAYIETLFRLRNGNIIKPVFEGSIGIGAGERWELVHDGLGQPLSEWAGNRRNDWDDCCSSLVACRGITPILMNADNSKRIRGTRLHSLRWEGCLVLPQDSQSQDNCLEEVTFDSCALRGTVFQDMIFKRCRFVRCELNGSIFKGCRFIDIEFADCEPESLAFIESEVHAMTFSRCRLSQLTVRDVGVMGRILFSDSEITLSNFVDLKGDSRESVLTFDEGSSVSYSSGDDMSWTLMDFRCRVENSRSKLSRDRT